MRRTSTDIAQLLERVSALETQIALLGQPTPQPATGTTTSAEAWGDVAAMQRELGRRAGKPSPVDASGRKAMRAETSEQTARIDEEAAKLYAQIRAGEPMRCNQCHEPCPDGARYRCASCVAAMASQPAKLATAKPVFDEAAKEAVLIVLLDLASRETPVSLGIARDRARKALGNIAALLGEAVKP